MNPTIKIHNSSIINPSEEQLVAAELEKKLKITKVMLLEDEHPINTITRTLRCSEEYQDAYKDLSETDAHEKRYHPIIPSAITFAGRMIKDYTSYNTADFRGSWDKEDLENQQKQTTNFITEKYPSIDLNNYIGENSNADISHLEPNQQEAITFLRNINRMLALETWDTEGLKKAEKTHRVGTLLLETAKTPWKVYANLWSKYPVTSFFLTATLIMPALMTMFSAGSAAIGGLVHLAGLIGDAYNHITNMSKEDWKALGEKIIDFLKNLPKNIYKFLIDANNTTDPQTSITRRHIVIALVAGLIAAAITLPIAIHFAPAIFSFGMLAFSKAILPVVTFVKVHTGIDLFAAGNITGSLATIAIGALAILAYKRGVFSRSKKAEGQENADASSVAAQADTRSWVQILKDFLVNTHYRPDTGLTIGDRHIFGGKTDAYVPCEDEENLVNNNTVKAQAISQAVTSLKEGIVSHEASYYDTAKEYLRTFVFATLNTNRDATQLDIATPIMQKWVEDGSQIPLRDAQWINTEIAALITEYNDQNPPIEEDTDEEAEQI